MTTMQTVTPWAYDCAWAADAMLERFSEVVPADAFATAGNADSPHRRLLSALVLHSGEKVMLHLYPSTETVKLVGQCPQCGAEYESHDLVGKGEVTPRRQVMNLLHHWRKVGNRCGPCEWGAYEEAEE